MEKLQNKAREGRRVALENLAGGARSARSGMNVLPFAAPAFKSTRARG